MGYRLIHELPAEERLDSKNIGNFRLKITELLDEGGDGIIIDLTKTEFIDSIGLGVLVSVLKKTAQREMKVGLYGLTPSIKRIFELTRFYRLFDVFDNVEEAKAAMR